MTEHSHNHGIKGSKNSKSLNAGNSRGGHNHAHGGKRRIKVKPGNTIGAVHTECNIHDGAIVISGSLVIETGIADVSADIAGKLEEAAKEIKDRGGVVGHIKTAVSMMSTSMVSVTDERAMVKEPPARRVRITLAAIAFLVDPREAEAILRTALTGMRARLRQE